MQDSGQNSRGPSPGDPRLPSPFFQAPAFGAAPLRRLLLISFHFPPGGAAGALRWQKLSRFAAERGWTLDVISLHPSALEQIDNTRLADLPPGTRVYGVSVPKLFLQRIEERAWRYYRKFRRGRGSTEDIATAGPQPQGAERSLCTAPERLHDRVSRQLAEAVRMVRRGYYAWMDYYTHGAWAQEVTRLGFRLLKSEKYEVIITCGPPHMAHEAGRRLAERTGVPLVVDFRDPWRLVQRLADVFDSALWYKLAEFYERRVVAKASLIVMNTTRAQTAMQAAYPAQRKQIIAVMNGYDEEAPRSTQMERKFVIAYAGAVYLDRDPTLLLKAVARVVRSLGLTPSDIGMEFMGHVQTYRDTSLQSLADAEGIANYVRIFGPGVRNAALEFLSRASVLVSLPQDSDMAVPSKLFEYMQFDAWILAITGPGSATELLLRDSEADVVAPDDLEGITQAVMSRFQQYRNGVRPVRLSASMPSAGRRVQASLLFDAIDEIVRSRKS